MQDDNQNSYMDFWRWQQSMWQQWLKEAGPGSYRQPGRQANPFAAAFNPFNPPGSFNPFNPPGSFNPFNPPNPFNPFNSASASSGWPDPWQAFTHNPWGSLRSMQLPGLVFGDWQKQWSTLCDNFTELAAKVSAASASNASDAADWMPQFDDMFDKVKQSFEQINKDNASRIADMINMFAGNPQWSGLTGGSFEFPGFPRVGPLRMQQQAMEQYAKKVSRLAKCSRDYIEYLGRIPVRALDLLKDKLLQMAAEDKAVTAIRELYDIWVSCMDTASREIVFSEEYPPLYADVNNALLHVLDSTRKHTDEHSRARGQVSRSSFDTVVRRQHLQQRVMHRDIMPTLGQISGDLRTVREQLQKLQRQTDELLPVKEQQAEQTSNLQELTQRLQRQVDELLPVKEQQEEQTSKLRELTQRLQQQVDELLPVKEQLGMLQQSGNLEQQAEQASRLQALTEQLQQLSTRIRDMRLPPEDINNPGADAAYQHGADSNMVQDSAAAPDNSDDNNEEVSPESDR